MKQVIRGGAYGYLLAAVAIASAGIALLLYATGLFHDTELASVDTRFSIRGDEKPRDDIVLVLIDDTTSRELPVRFPFPRSLHARVVNTISQEDPKAIAYDVEFLQPTKQKQDTALIDAVARAGPNKVVLADSQPDPQGRSGVFGGQKLLDDIGARAGNTQIGEDSDGVRRRVPYEVGNMETFPLVAAEIASGKQITTDQMGGPTAWIDYAGGPGTYPSVPFSRVLTGQFPPGTFDDKVVVVGASDPALKDIAETPMSRSDLTSGAEINANAIATALDGFPLKSTPLGFDLFLIALMGVIAPLASYRLSPIQALALGLLAAALYLICAQLAFNSGRIVPVLYPMIALGLSLIGSLLVYYVREAFIRRRVRDTFARFVPESVVGEVLARTDDDLRLQGRRMDVTVLFSDIRGFTTFSEARDPGQVLDVLNHYHEEMTAAVMDHGGTLISFMGDGIMATFGSPIEMKDHADRAFAAAKEMLEVRLPRVNEWMRENDVGDEFQIGIGLNSGPVMAGNIGSEQRLEFTTIGDTVNTAARLEGMTKGSGHSLFVADSTRERLSDRDGDLGFVDSFPVRGRAEEIRVWAPA
ncbi:MAG TPA: adenylate/guanylate cyclase domain-containing protein [Solirubrobacterales bacterium]|jgi:adenylate cyclase|nr:adenylate/guanylate cyclase domain-containing protein [Solirubrobacterales bacterium]